MNVQAETRRQFLGWGMGGLGRLLPQFRAAASAKAPRR